MVSRGSQLLAMHVLDIIFNMIPSCKIHRDIFDGYTERVEDEGHDSEYYKSWKLFERIRYISMGDGVERERTRELRLYNIASSGHVVVFVVLTVAMCS